MDSSDDDDYVKGVVTTKIPDIPVRKSLRPCCAFGADIRAEIARILDGGQATLFLVESLNRKPLSLRTKLAVQQVGFTMLVLLMGLAFWNDLARLWSRWLPPGP